MRAAALAFATCLGVGYSPFAPGTVGSLVGLALWAVLPGSFRRRSSRSCASFGVGVWASSAAERHFRATDPGPVVIDEVMGMLVDAVPDPGRLAGRCSRVPLVPYLRRHQAVSRQPSRAIAAAALGVMADDLMAGIYANLALRATLASWDLIVG